MKSLRFETEEDLFYRVEKTNDLRSWTEIFSVDGFGGPVIIPMAQITGQPTPLGTNLPEQEGVMIHLSPTTSNGTLVSWRSLDVGYLVQHHLPSIDLTQTWNTAPLVNFITDNYYMGVVRGDNLVNAPTTALPPLLTEDSSLMSQFVSDYSDIASGLGGSGTIGVPIANASFFRIRVSEADIDRDGIPDRIERLPLPSGTATDRFKPDTDGDGYWDGAETAQNKNPNDPYDHPDPQSRPSTIQDPSGPLVLPLKFDPVEVGFHQKNHVLQSDNGKTNYVSPQWRAESHNYPVSYKRGEEITLSGKFRLPAYVAGAFVQVSGPNGISFPAPVALFAIGDNLWELTPSICDGNLVDKIKFYSTQIAGKEFKLNWTITTSDQTFLTPSQDTKHTMYVTHGEPLLGNDRPKRIIRRETAFNIGCRNADGKEEDPNALGGTISKLDITRSIYGEFTDREVARVIPTQGFLRNEAMTYWADTNGDGKPDGACRNALSLLASDDGNANCEAWAFLLREICRAQGFSVEVVGILPTNEAEQWFCVKNMSVQNANPNYGPIYQWVIGTNLDQFSPPNQNGTPGPLLGVSAQGLNLLAPPADPRKIFATHYLAQFEATLFDPSYGHPPISGQNRLQIYEDSHIEFYGFNALLGLNPAVGCRQNTNIGSSEIISLPATETP